MAALVGDFDNHYMSSKSVSDDPGAAITRVLNAEQEAGDAIERCVAEAEKVLADARSRARNIVRTTQRRIGRLHTVARTETERRVRVLEEEASGRPSSAESEHTSRTLLMQAAADAARTLTTREGSQDAD